MTSIFVAKLDFGITSEQLKQAFEAYGKVLKATVAMDRETGKSRGFGFVEMLNREEAMSAIEHLDGSLMNGRPIAVKEAEQRGAQKPQRPQNNPRQNFDKPREYSGGKPPFKDRTENPPAFNKGEDDIEPKAFVPPVIDPLKPENRKKDKDKDRKIKERDVEGRGKKTKMSAYKKSGKNNRFMEDDEDEDWDLTPYNNYDEEDEDFQEDEFDEED